MNKCVGGYTSSTLSSFLANPRNPSLSKAVGKGQSRATTCLVWHVCETLLLIQSIPERGLQGNSDILIELSRRPSTKYSQYPNMAIFRSLIATMGSSRTHHTDTLYSLARRRVSAWLPSRHDHGRLIKHTKNTTRAGHPRKRPGNPAPLR